jgi:hypothetical protein
MTRFSILRVFAVMAKEFTQLRRDRVTFAMILGLPIMQLLLFGYAINNDPRHLPAAVVSHDTGPLARAVISSLERTTYVDVRYLPRSEADMDQLSGRARRGRAVAGRGAASRSDRAGRGRRDGSAVRGGGAPALQPREHHFLQYRARAARHHPLADAGDDDGDGGDARI